MLSFLHKRLYIFIIWAVLPAWGFSQTTKLVVPPDSVIVDSLDDAEIEDAVDSVFHYELVRPPGFRFDTLLIPSKNIYNTWDTNFIDPYRENMVLNFDSISLVLCDSSGGCTFVQPCTNGTTSGFGYRRWGWGYKFHYGIDFGLKTGDPVYAAFDGVVRVSQYNPGGYGYMVIIRHYNGFETLYGHFSKLLVYPGQSVRAGDVVGLGGSTGHSTGSHLHFEIRYKGKPIDPTRFIDFNTHTVLKDTVTVSTRNFDHLRPTPQQIYWQNYYKNIHAKKGRLYYTVRRYDNIYSIATKYHTTAKRLYQMNGINSRTKLKAGRRLRVR